MVVEDESVVATDIADSLATLGYQVIASVQTGEDAMKEAEKHHPDLALMDIRLKGSIDGVTAAAFIHENLRIPVVFLTAYADEKTLQRAKITEPYGYILKPFEEAELRAALELALHKHAMELEKSGKEAPAARWTQSPGVNVGGDAAKSSYEFLKKISPFNQLPDRTLRSLADSCRFANVGAKDLIACEGEENISGFIPVSGRVAMVKTSLNGKELIVELIPPGDIYGLVVALEKSPYPLTARAQTDSQILWVPRSTLVLLLEEHPELYRAFTEKTSQRLRTSHDLSRGLAHDRVEVRIATTLVSLVSGFAEAEEEHDSYTIDITRQEIADLTGTTPETTIRITKDMERDGFLDLARPGVIRILDLETLQNIASE